MGYYEVDYKMTTKDAVAGVTIERALVVQLLVNSCLLCRVLDVTVAQALPGQRSNADVEGARPGSIQDAVCAAAAVPPKISSPQKFRPMLSPS